MSITLALRKQALVNRSQALRGALKHDAAALAHALGWADKAHALWQWLRAHPGLAAAGVAALIALQPQRLTRWARRGLLAWGICRRAGAIWQSASALWHKSRG